MRKSGPTAPRWALALLRRLAPPGRAEDALGDLEETHRRRVARWGRVAGTVVTGLEALDMALTLMRDRIRRRRTTVSSSASERQQNRRRAIGISWLDIKLGLRMLVKHPGLSLVGGLGIAVAVALGAGTFASGATE